MLYDVKEGKTRRGRVTNLEIFIDYVSVFLLFFFFFFDINFSLSRVCNIFDFNVILVSIYKRFEIFSIKKMINI